MDGAEEVAVEVGGDGEVEIAVEEGGDGVQEVAVVVEDGEEVAV